MKHLFFKLFFTLGLISIFINSCDSPNSETQNHEEKNEIIEESDDLFNPELNEEWIKNNTPKKNENLINFTFKIGNQDDYEKFKNILLNPYEKDDSMIKHSELEISEHEDSTVISFWQIRILEGCKINGNIEIRDDTLSLLFEKICSPYEEFTDGEYVTLFHKYTIESNALRKNIITEEINVK